MNDVAEPAELYGPTYYASHCGSVPYERDVYWLNVFGGIADQLVRSFAPRTVFDAGCAMGMLVESLWDRAVETHGRDISEFAISRARPDMRPFLAVGSIAEPIEGEYDLVACIEVVEHMPAEEADRAIRTIAAVTSRVLFSSSPIDFDEPTHINVRPPLYWLERWAEAGFAPSVTHDAGYLAPHAFVVERSDVGRSPRDLIAFADRIRHRTVLGMVAGRANALAGAKDERDAAQQELATVTAQRDRLIEEAVAHVQDAERLRQDAERLQQDAERLRADLVQATSRLTQAELARKQSGQDAERLRIELEKVSEAKLRAALAEAERAARETLVCRGEYEAAEQRAVLQLGVAQHQIRVAKHQMGRAEAAEAASRRAEVERAAALHEAALATHHARGEREALERALFTAVAEREAVMTSVTWRLMAPVRAGLAVVPRPVRRATKSSLRTLSAAARFRLGSHLRLARAERRAAAAVARCPLFDQAWYRGQNPDVAIGTVPPALHYVRHGEAEGRHPGPHFSPRRYLHAHPEAAGRGPLVLHAIQHRQELSGLPDAAPSPPTAPELVRVAFDPGHTLPAPPSQPGSPGASAPSITVPYKAAEIPTVDEELDKRFFELRPLRVFAAPHSGRRLTIVTDSINPGSLYGGVGTAMVLGAMAARRMGASLRLVTRIQPAVASSIGEVLSLQGVSWDGNVELVHSPWEGQAWPVPMGERDLFLTTSWWTTWCTRLSVPRPRIAYLVQEDERMFYPHGDSHLQASETLRDPAITYLVNSELLLQHLSTERLAPGGVAFEPSFPSDAYHPPKQANAGKEKRKFFFYARPTNLRNLYWRGLEALASAIEQGVLDPAEWEFYFAGRDASPIRLPRGTRPILVENLPWSEYTALIRRMDLGLSLMYTPHTSYPPLDLAASGAVVVTNRFPPKVDLDRYCGNIIIAEPDVASLVTALRQGVQLVHDSDTRHRNFETAGLARDWSVSARAAVEHLAAWADRTAR